LVLFEFPVHGGFDIEVVEGKQSSLVLIWALLAFEARHEVVDSIKKVSLFLVDIVFVGPLSVFELGQEELLGVLPLTLATCIHHSDYLFSVKLSFFSEFLDQFLVHSIRCIRVNFLKVIHCVRQMLTLVVHFFNFVLNLVLLFKFVTELV